MTVLFNKKEETKKRQILRNNLTSAEKVIWKKIRNKQVNGLKFRRQVSIGKYVVDFYCPEINLIIEIDGANHFFDKKSSAYDNKRQDFMETKRIQILRFTNTDVYYNMESVLEKIYNYCHQLTPSQPSPS